MMQFWMEEGDSVFARNRRNTGISCESRVEKDCIFEENVLYYA